MIVEPKREILLGPLLRAGLQRAWAQRDNFLRLGTLPLLAMVAILVPLQKAVFGVAAAMQANRLPDDGGAMPQILLLTLVYAAVLNVFAVNWLRQLTLGTPGAPGLGLSLSGRHFRFFFLIIALSLGIGILSSIAVLLLAAVGGVGSWGLMAAMLIWAAIMIRVSPSWIGIALDAPMPLSLAWRRTAGQGFKLLVALLAVEVPLMVLQELVGVIFTATGLLTAAPLTVILVTAVIQLIGTAAQLAILVTAYPHFLRETV